jgi:hypothetical protein
MGASSTLPIDGAIPPSMSASAKLIAVYCAGSR